jgi:hypothetical protein
MVAVAGVGCSGDDRSERTFTAADARRLAAVRPDGPDWTWPADEEKRIESGRTKEEIAAEDPIYAAYLARTRGIEDVADEGSRWRDDDKVANLTVEVVKSAEDAEVVFDASNDLSRGYGEQYGFVSRAEEIDGLADEAWVLWASAGGQGITYHWRRGNLVVEAHVDCFGRCPPDVDAATRAWVDAIDAETRK